MLGRRALLLAPLGLAVASGGAFAVLLHRMQRGRFDPRELPSPLVGQRAPDVAMPPLDGAGPGIAGAQFASAGRPVLLNFFASWCMPCVVEHPALLALKAEGLPLWGVAYKDKPEAARAFLARHGSPYARVASDQPGSAGIEWGVTGVPETFLIDGAGVVRWRYPGPLTPEVVADRLRPALRAVA